MTLAAGSWYTSAAFSSTLATAGVLVAVVIAVLTTKALRLPLRRSLQFTTEIQPLTDGPPAMPAPYLITFSLTNRSRADIRSEDFDDKRPLTFDLGTPVTLLGAVGSEDHAGFRVQDSSILVGPALIRRGESLSLTLLASERPVVKYRHTPAEVSLRAKRSGHRRAGLTVPVVGALLVATNLAAGLMSHYLTSSGSPAPWPTVTVTATGRAGPDMALVNPQAGNPPLLQSTSFVTADSGSGGIRAVAYSPDSRYLVTGDANSGIYIWNVATRKSFTIHDPNSLGVNAVAFSQNGSYFASGDGNSNVYLWSPAFTLEATLPDQNSGGVRALAFSPDGSFLAAGYANGNLYVWNLAKRTAESFRDPNNLGVNAVAVSPDSIDVAVGDGNGHVYVRSSALTRDEHQSDSVAVRALAYNRTGSYLAVGDLNGNTYIWDTTTWTVVATPAVSNFTCGVNAVAFSPDSNYLAVGDCDGHLYLWTGMLSGTASLVMQSASSDFQQTGGITAVAFSPDGHYLAAGSSNGNLYEWQAGF